MLGKVAGEKPPMHAAAAILSCSFFTHNLIKDPWHDVVVCGIPKGGITSLRHVLNARCVETKQACLPCRGARCAEFKMNRRWSLRRQKLVVLLRDPYRRMVSAYRDEDNLYIQREIPRVARLSLGSFVDFVHENWGRLSANEHFTPQTTLCQLRLQHYHYVGCVDNASHVAHLYTALLGARVTRIHTANAANGVPTGANMSKIGEMYRADYDFMERRGLLTPGDARP